jgi:hypothetical protein
VADLRHSPILLLLLLLLGCSRLSDLTPQSLQAAQAQWEKSGPASYRMVVETSGDHMDTSKYEVTVKAKSVVKLERNGSPLQPQAGGNSYTVEGLFKTLDEEIDLKGKPQLLGAPPGYSSYPMASFDSATGRLLRFQRSVGGTKNSIEIIVREFEVLER